MNRVSRRRIRGVVLVPCLAIGLVILAHFTDIITGVLSHTPSIAIRTVTVTVEQPRTALYADLQSGTYDDEEKAKEGRRVKDSDRPTRQHLFRSNGLMEVNPDGRHPMFELIERGEAKWNAKVKRQSKTLYQAVEEYRRRHKRAPPKGFDFWWHWCEINSVQLPDEYDQIQRDLEPFWAINPHDLQHLMAKHEAKVAEEDSYVIGKEFPEDPISLMKMNLTYEGNMELAHYDQAWDFMDMLEQVQDFIPPFRAVFSPHDNPNLHTDWIVKSQMIKAAAAGIYIDVTKPPEVKLNGWTEACDPRSPARQTPFDLDNPPPPSTKKTFIYDHVKSMDPCQHPSLLHKSSQFLSHNYGPIPQQILLPHFSMCSTMLHHDISPANPIAWVEDTNPEDDVPWAQKEDERLLWRGTSTGMWSSKESRWRGQQRVRLVGMANARNGTVPILAPRVTRDEKVGEPVDWKKARVNPAMMDIVFAGEPHSCEDEICEVMKEEYRFTGEHMGHKEAGRYKFVFDTDGNGWSSRFKRLMVSRSLVFKSTIYPEWFAGRVQEYVHYIPIQMDFSDLYDALTFFRGDLNGDNAHDDLAEKIATAGREWAKTHWRQEDLTAYMFRLMLEYARLVSLDREAASLADEDVEKWV